MVRVTRTKALEIAAEQYWCWSAAGWTHHEMVMAIKGRWVDGMDGDDVLFLIADAWNSLNR